MAVVLALPGYGKTGVLMVTQTIRSGVVGAMAGAMTVYAALIMTVNPTPIIEPPTPFEIIQAYNQGRIDALKLNPVSWDLEQACANLWANRLPVDTQK
jgi:hypothetical protein